MTQDVDHNWLDWAKRLQAIGQTGLTYAKDQYDIERYESIRRIAAEMMASRGGGCDVETLVGFFSREGGYATPKVDVRAAVFQDDKILLVKEREDGGWTLPGGWADVGDSPSLAAVREVKEESGYDVVARKLVAVFDRNMHPHPPIGYHAYKLFFACDLVGGAAAISNETDEVGFFQEDKIPALSIGRVTTDQIRLMFEHERKRDLSTVFD